MLIWAACTICFGFWLGDLLARLYHNEMLKGYPKHQYLEVGKLLCERKTYSEIEQYNFNRVIPIKDRIRCILSYDTLFSTLLIGGVIYFIFMMSVHLIIWLFGLFSDDDQVVLTQYRENTSAIFFAFIGVTTKWVVAKAYFAQIANEIRQDGLVSKTKIK